MDQTGRADAGRGGKGREAFRTISEVAEQLDLPQHVLRFWESKFSQIKPLKRGGNRRYYRPDDVTLIMAIKKLLHADGYTIRGVQKLFKAQGLKATIALALEGDSPAQFVDVTEANIDPVQNTVSANKYREGVLERPSHGLDQQQISTIIDRLKALRAEIS